MSLNSFSSEDKIRAGIVRPKPWKNVGLIERPDHYLKQFRGQGAEKIYWSVGEIAEMLQVEATTIRYWLKEFGIEIPKSRAGHRMFSAQDVEKVKQIHYLLKVRLFTLEGAKREMQNGR